MASVLILRPHQRSDGDVQGFPVLVQILIFEVDFVRDRPSQEVHFGQLEGESFSELVDVAFVKELLIVEGAFPYCAEFFAVVSHEAEGEKDEGRADGVEGHGGAGDGADEVPDD
jgi:hypothetical protein